MSKILFGFAVLALLLYGCCGSTALTKANDITEQATIDAVRNSTCVGNLTIGQALSIDAHDHIGQDAKWYGFTIRNSDDSYNVYINWANGDEKYEYKFTYDPATKELGSMNKEARLVLDTCRSA